jgi:tRNA-binding protein
MTKDAADFSAFLALDIRAGVILSATPAQTKKPTLRMTIDFGPEIGTKVSCGAYTNYEPAELVGRQVMAVVNFPPRKMGPEISEVLVLGVQNPAGDGTIFLTAERAVPAGAEVF